MDKLLKAFILLMILCTGPARLTGQEGFSASGSNALGAGGTMSYTIGQAVYTDFSSPAGHVTPGIQQAYLAIMVAANDPQPAVSVGFFPNPVQTIVHLSINEKVSGIDDGNNTYRLFDLYGKCLLQGEMTGDMTRVAVDGLAEGVYFMEVSLSGPVFKTFKVIKTN